ncbi:hypothetical protein DENIS_0969 [Desulfonema ishimotonii]|uniref:N-acetyltransferase domain-containing protein n=1 Tax=Desulfonema ishimotonii TaxID=45657 RepID=A0A401FST5_9BACT|nr:GNAT family N-acetyltransferase [Desulfonema ishimotonii]GBC60027.1 hypothetical protein DENIS_0969 [Desulfonema ishimotonii]
MRLILKRTLRILKMEIGRSRSVPGMTDFSGNPVSLGAVEIETERLVLRPVSMKYADVIYRNFTAQITRYMYPAPPEKIRDTGAFIRNSMKRRKQGTELVLAILCRKSGEFIGCCGIHAEKNPARPELGIWIKAAFHGHGCGREAVAGLKAWAERTVAYEYLVYPVDRRNIPSRKIAEAIGGRVADAVKVEALHGGILDEVIYRIDPPEHP